MSINTVRLILVLVVTLGLFSLLGLAVFLPVKGFQIEIFDAVLGALLTAFTGMVAYFFFRD